VKWGGADGIPAGGLELHFTTSGDLRRAFFFNERELVRGRVKERVRREKGRNREIEC